MHLKLALFFGLVCALWAYAPSSKSYVSQYLSSRDGTGGSHDVNQTLGFEKIFVINLPFRTDRRDALALMASVTDMKLDFTKAVKGEDVAEASLPYGSEPPNAGGIGTRGSWRSHLNIIRTVVENRLSTALVMEDDVDWDVRLQEQMSRLWSNLGQERLQSWDVLWLGHYGESFDPADPGLTTFHDPTLPENLTYFYSRSASNFPPRTRGVHRSEFPLATFAYAVSYHGARKILHQIGLKSTAAEYDNALAQSCLTILNCFSLTPGLFHDYKAAGSPEKHSSSNPQWEKEQPHELFSENIELSVRQYIGEELGKPNDHPRQPLSGHEIGMRWVEALKGERFKGERLERERHERERLKD